MPLLTIMESLTRLPSITLPLAANFSTAKDLTIRNYRAELDDMEIVCQGSDSIWSLGNPTSFILNPGQNLTLQSDGIDKWIPKQSHRPNVLMQEGILETDEIVTSATVSYPSTEITVLWPGLYQLLVNARYHITGVPGNQPWDFTIGIYNTTDSTWLEAFNVVGAANPLSDAAEQFTRFYEVTTENTGDALRIAAYRDTTTGTITLLQNETWLQFIGPFS